MWVFAGILKVIQNLKVGNCGYLKFAAVFWVRSQGFKWVFQKTLNSQNFKEPKNNVSLHFLSFSRKSCPKGRSGFVVSTKTQMQPLFKQCYN